MPIRRGIKRSRINRRDLGQRASRTSPVAEPLILVGRQEGWQLRARPAAVARRGQLRSEAVFDSGAENTRRNRRSEQSATMEIQRGMTTSAGSFDRLSESGGPRAKWSAPATRVATSRG